MEVAALLLSVGAEAAAAFRVNVQKKSSAITFFAPGVLGHGSGAFRGAVGIFVYAHARMLPPCSLSSRHHSVKAIFITSIEGVSFAVIARRFLTLCSLLRSSVVKPALVPHHFGVIT